LSSSSSRSSSSRRRRRRRSAKLLLFRVLSRIDGDGGRRALDGFLSREEFQIFNFVMWEKKQKMSSKRAFIEESRATALARASSDPT